MYRIQSRAVEAMTSSVLLPATSSDDVTVMATAAAAAGTRRITWYCGAVVRRPHTACLERDCEQVRRTHDGLATAQSSRRINK